MKYQLGIAESGFQMSFYRHGGKLLQRCAVTAARWSLIRLLFLLKTEGELRYLADRRMGRLPFPPG